MQAFLACLKANGNDGRRCREESKAYLGCRMDRCAREDDGGTRDGRRVAPETRDGAHLHKRVAFRWMPVDVLCLCARARRCPRNLMAREEWKTLGFHDADAAAGPSTGSSKSSSTSVKA
jgi:hypothetical protein